MRKNTPKRAAINRKADELRREFIEQNQQCWICEAWGTQCHEICQGCNRHEAILQPMNYLAVCPRCHEHLHGSPVRWSAERQVALKFLNSSYTLTEIIQCVNSMRIKDVWVDEVKWEMRMS